MSLPGSGGVRYVMARRVVISIMAIAVLAALMLFAVSDWYHMSKQSFGIYLVKNNGLIIADNDITSYTWSSHILRLTEDSAKRIRELSVPVSGEPFALKVNGKEMYSGYFWTSISSVSCNGVVIDVLKIQDNCVRIEKGYPSESFFTGEDPRNRKEIFEYFQSTGRLVQ